MPFGHTDNQSDIATFICPCCAYDGLARRPYERWPDRLPVDATPPYEVEFGTGSHERCRCCGFEFGHHDDPQTGPLMSFESYRASWIRSGSRWLDPALRPIQWSLDRQLGGAGIDPPRLTVSHGPLMTGEAMIQRLRSVCPEAVGVLDIESEYSSEPQTHTVLSDLCRFAERAYESQDSEVVRRCLSVVAESFECGTDYLCNAVAVSFVEGCDHTTEFVRSWPAALRAEEHRQRTWYQSQR